MIKTEKEKSCIGVVVNAHGINGSVIVKPFTDSFSNFLKYKFFFTTKESACLNISSIKQKSGKPFFIVKFKEVNDRNASEELKGTELYILRKDLPELNEDVFYYTDLIGMIAKGSSNNSVIGYVKNIHNFGAGDMLEITYQDEENKKEKSFNILFNKDSVPDVNISENFITVDESFIVT